MPIMNSLSITRCALMQTVLLASLFQGSVDAAAGGGASVAEDVFAAACRTEMLQAAADKASAGIMVAEVGNLVTGVELESGAKYFAETDRLPAHCQVSGSFVTNPETGKTANFVATFPYQWNGKYLQYGCFGTCGFMVLNDATSPAVDIIAQGLPGDSLRKGYASFGTDEGHESREAASWAIKDGGGIDQEAIDDFLYRATAVLAVEGRAFTEAFYSQLYEEPQQVKRAYFNGCSGGGRDALVAASYFSQAFDGIIAGSPAGDFAGLAFQDAAVAKAVNRSASSALTPVQLELLHQIVDRQCDSLDGVEDGLIQNPAACDFVPERDLPHCTAGEEGDHCFTKEQLQTLSVMLSAVTDEHGHLVQPGYSVSNLLVPGLGEIIRDVLKVFAFNNAPDFDLETLIELREHEGPGGSYYRAVVPADIVATATAALQRGIGTDPQKLDSFMEADGKLLVWHDLSDQLLTPYTSINYYKQLAERHGGYEALKEQVRLFSLPGTLHCSGGIGGVGPNSFDALSALENWVENGVAPQALLATYYPGTEIGGKDFSAPAGRTMPLCAFPAMAQYQGYGAIDSADSWQCRTENRSMLETGPSGQRAGVMP